MNTKKNTPTGDPIGQAILDYSKNKKPFDIIVSSDLCDDDIIPIEVLFRTEKDMPELELEALSLCKGKVLDIGAGAGVHSLVLQDYGLDVQAIDLSAGAVTYMKSMGLNAKQLDFYSLNNKQKYNTILSLMNGFGLAQTLANLPVFLKHAFDLLEPGGCLPCGSTSMLPITEISNFRCTIIKSADLFSIGYMSITIPCISMLLKLVLNAAEPALLTTTS